MKERPDVKGAEDFAAEVDELTARFEEVVSSMAETLPGVVDEYRQAVAPLRRLMAALDESDSAIVLADFLVTRLD